MKTATFGSLSHYHQELDQLFDSHQRALLGLDFDLALSALSKFGSELESHIDFEEKRLLPLYADQGETAGGTLEIFQSEHRKLREGIASLLQRTEQLFTAPDVPGAVIALLGDEAMFKSLFHHHATREQKVLFPRLDERSTAEERETWLAGN